MMTRVRDCKTCGKAFVVGRRKLYCSSRCYKEYFREQKKAERIARRKANPIVCQQCGKTVPNMGRGRKYCSVECRNEYHLRRKRSKRPGNLGRTPLRYTKECLWCGDDYQGDGRTKYCSPECRQADDSYTRKELRNASTGSHRPRR